MKEESMSLVKLEWKETKTPPFLKDRVETFGSVTRNHYDIRVYNKEINPNRYRVIYRVYVNSIHSNDFKHLKDAKLWCLVLENREMIEKENVDILTA